VLIFDALAPTLGRKRMGMLALYMRYASYFSVYHLYPSAVAASFSLTQCWMFYGAAFYSVVSSLGWFAAKVFITNTVA